jgi:hypothetical protein
LHCHLVDDDGAVGADERGVKVEDDVDEEGLGTIL